jgi:hypothetical protein
VNRLIFSTFIFLFSGCLGTSTEPYPETIRAFDGDYSNGIEVTFQHHPNLLDADLETVSAYRLVVESPGAWRSTSYLDQSMRIIVEEYGCLDATPACTEYRQYNWFNRGQLQSDGLYWPLIHQEGNLLANDDAGRPSIAAQSDTDERQLGEAKTEFAEFKFTSHAMPNHHSAYGDYLQKTEDAITAAEPRRNFATATTNWVEPFPGADTNLWGLDDTTQDAYEQLVQARPEAGTPDSCVAGLRLVMPNTVMSSSKYPAWHFHIIGANSQFFSVSKEDNLLGQPEWIASTGSAAPNHVDCETVARATAAGDMGDWWSLSENVDIANRLIAVEIKHRDTTWTRNLPAGAPGPTVAFIHTPNWVPDPPGQLSWQDHYVYVNPQTGVLDRVTGPPGLLN